jgi:hypothetical protein
MFGWDHYGFHKKRARTSYEELVFLLPVGSVGNKVYSGAFGAQNVDALFFMLGWDRYGFHNKRARTRYTELVFLHLWIHYGKLEFYHPVGSAVHVMDFGAYRA